MKIRKIYMVESLKKLSNTATTTTAYFNPNKQIIRPGNTTASATIRLTFPLFTPAGYSIFLLKYSCKIPGAIYP
jgi:hypothetical protein